MSSRNYHSLAILLIVLLFMTIAFPSYAEAPKEQSSGAYTYIVNDDGTATITHIYTATFSWGNDNPTIASSLGGHVVTTLAYNVFESNEYLEYLTIPDSIVKFEGNPFVGLSGLTTITVSKNHPTFATIDGVLFDKTTKTLLCYPIGIESEGYTIPSGIVAIGDSAFGSAGLKSISIPESVTEIGDYAFNFCGLSEITLPPYLEKIGAGAFRGNRITDIVLPDTLKEIGDLAFIDADFTDLFIPASVEKLGANPFLRAKCQIRIDDANKYYRVIDGVVFDYAAEKIICYPLSLNDRVYSIPETCKVIGESSFAYTSAELEEVIIPSSVEIIEEGSFASSSIKNMVIGSKVTTIPDRCFNFCDNLESITIPDTVTSIGSEAFNFCEIDQIYVPASVVDIGEKAFGGSLTDIKLLVEEGSYAEQYAKSNKLKYSYPESTDWLN